MTTDGLAAHRTWLRRYPTWLFALCLAAAWLLDRTAFRQTVVAVVAIAGLLIGVALEIRYNRRARPLAPELIARALSAPVIAPMRVRQSRTAAVATLTTLFLVGLFCVGHPIYRLVEPGAERFEPSYLPFTLAMLPILAALLIGYLIMAGAGVGKVSRALAGRPLLDLDESGIWLGDEGLTVAWSEIDQIYCMDPLRRRPGLSLHLIDPIRTMSRSSRGRVALRLRLRSLNRDQGWIFTADSDLHEPLSDVITAAISLHHAVTLSSNTSRAAPSGTQPLSANS